MSAWWWSASILLLVVGVVVLPVLRLWDWWQARTAARRVEHDGWIRQILGDDQQVAELEAALRTVAREHKQNS